MLGHVGTVFVTPGFQTSIWQTSDFQHNLRSGCGWPRERHGRWGPRGGSDFWTRAVASGIRGKPENTFFSCRVFVCTVLYIYVYIYMTCDYVFVFFSRKHVEKSAFEFIMRTWIYSILDDRIIVYIFTQTILYAENNINPWLGNKWM